MMAACIAAAPALSGCAELGELDVFSEPQSDEDRLPETAPPRTADVIGSGTSDIFTDGQVEEDLIPAGATPTVIDGIDSDSTRLLWTSDGFTYFAALSEDMGNCLVVVEGLTALAACSPSLPIQVGGGRAPDVLFGDDLPDRSQNWVKIADHLWTRPE